MPYSYLISKEGIYIKARDPYGRVQFHDTDAATVLLDVMNELSNGGKIFIKAGTYLITQKLLFPNPNITLIGEGHGVSISHGVTILKQADGANLDQIINNNGKQNCHLRDLFIDGNQSHNTTHATGIDFTGDDNAIENIGVMYCYNGLNLNTHASYFKQIFSEANNNVGFQIAGYGNVFEDLYAAAGNGNISFYILGDAYNNTFLGCIAQDDTNDGFTLQSYGGLVHHNTFIGCHALQESGTSGHHGFRLLGAQYNTFIGCKVRNMGQAADNTYDGFYLATQDSTHSIKNQFIGCSAYSDTTNKLRYGFNEADANQDYNVYVANIIYGMATASLNIQGVNSVQDDNVT